MNIFIAFGYQPQNDWIKELVFPLVRAFDFEVVTGEDLHGQVITTEVRNRIKEADALLGFITSDIHTWVEHELVLAMQGPQPAIEIREKNIAQIGGYLQDKQHLLFDLDAKAELLVQLATILSKWRRAFKFRRFVLNPKDLVLDVRPHMKHNSIKCGYQFRTGNTLSITHEAVPFKLGQVLCLDINHVPSEDSLVRFILTGPGLEWNSGFEPVDILTVNLEKF